MVEVYWRMLLCDVLVMILNKMWILNGWVVIVIIIVVVFIIMIIENIFFLWSKI